MSALQDVDSELTILLHVIQRLSNYNLPIRLDSHFREPQNDRVLCFPEKSGLRTCKLLRFATFTLVSFQNNVLNILDLQWYFEMRCLRSFDQIPQRLYKLSQIFMSHN